MLVVSIAHLLHACQEFPALLTLLSPELHFQKKFKFKPSPLTQNSFVSFPLNHLHHIKKQTGLSLDTLDDALWMEPDGSLQHRVLTATGSVWND